MASKPDTAGYSRNILLLIIILNSFTNPFLGAAVNIALPQIGQDFAMNAISLSWVAMSFLLSSAVFLVPLGKLADITGRKRIFLYGNALITLSAVLCIFSTSGNMLIAFRALQGIGSAMTFGTGIAIITSAFPVQERGRAIGISVTAVYLGLSVAPFLGGILTQTFGWRSLFFVTIPSGLLVIFLTWFAIKVEWAEARSELFDYRGSLVYMLAISSLMYGFSKLPDPVAIILTMTGIAGVIFFIWLELKTPYPVLNIQLFRSNRIFAYSNLAALINYAATFAITFLLSLYLQYIKGLSPREAGIVLVTQPLLMTIFASISGRMSDQYDSRILSSTGMGIIVVGLVLLACLSEETSLSFIVVSLAILGTGFGLFSSPNTNAVMSSVEKRYLGVASATIGTMRLTGQMMSMGIATLVIHVFIGKAQITSANHHLFLSGVTTVFILFSLLCFLGVFASLARGRVSP
ncbi:MAG: MFS transporter [Prolixibacteraceae bacterium]